MTVTYRFLLPTDLEQFDAFCSAQSISIILSKWMRDGIISENPMFKISAEFYDDQLVGIMAASSIGYWYKVSEILPIWLGVRIDRKKNLTRTNFTSFLHNASSLITDFFESQHYFHHYIIRRLPRAEISPHRFAQITKIGWGQGPYIPVVERIIRSQDDFEKLPTLFKGMLGTFATPVAILSMNMTNDEREKRAYEQRQIISV
jgi:hypothetical protein